MPILVLILAYLPTAYVIMRAAMFGILESNYIRTARAKGLPNRWVVLKHGLRNALLPVITSFMVDFGQLLGGVTVIEAVFNYRGIGNMMFEAVKSRDYPLLQGGFLLFTVTILLLIYRYAFQNSLGGDYGEATALSLMLAIFLGLLSWLYFKLTERWSTRAIAPYGRAP